MAKNKSAKTQETNVTKTAADTQTSVIDQMLADVAKYVAAERAHYDTATSAGDDLAKKEKAKKEEEASLGSALTTLSMIGDWHADNNEGGLAEAYHWMARSGKRPYIPGEGKSDNASWFNAATISGDLGDTSSDVPGPVYDKLPGDKTTANHKMFEGVVKAVTSLAAAFAAARSGGWTPE